MAKKAAASRKSSTSAKAPAKPAAKAKPGKDARAPKAAAKPAGKGGSKPAAAAKAAPTSAKKPAPKPATKPVETKKPVEVKKPPDVKKVAVEPKADSKKVGSPAAGGAAAQGGGKLARKGITIVQPKPVKPVKPKPPPLAMAVAAGPQPVRPNGRKPLIPSGPDAAPMNQFGHLNAEDKPKSPFGKRELEQYRQVLLRKRAELVGDVKTMESEALRGQSGSLSHTPQHIAEQGSEAYEQSLSLDLAAADRKIIKEIDDALQRIDNGTYGVCELTHKPINPERLQELPWTRYSIEAARELERRSMRV